MLLKIPDIRQGTDYDCGAACIDAVCRYWGRRSRGPVSLANPVQGMAPETVAAWLRSLGAKVLSGSLFGVADLQHFTRAGLPVLCPITAAGGGHWVVVRGVERGRVYYHCPVEGEVSVRAAQWLDQWRDHTDSGHTYDRWGIVAQFGG